MNNEEKLIYGQWKHDDFSAWAWRRLPEIPDWRVYVKYGDDGYDVDPGIYGESIDKAILEVGIALEKMEGLYIALHEFKGSQETR